MNVLRRLSGRRDSPAPDPGFLDLLAQGGLAAYERQLAFSELSGDREWLLDQSATTLRLGDDLVLPAQLLGSVSHDSGTWLWAWANPSIEASMAAAAERAKAFGEERGIAVITEPEVAVARIGDGHLLALAVADALAADAYYHCPYDGGAAYVLVELPGGVPLARETPGRRAGTVVRAAIADLPALVFRRSVEAYLARVGATVTLDQRVITVADGPAFSFDELGRLTGIAETLGA